MPLFKVWNKSRDVKKAVVASCFTEFVSKTKQDCKKKQQKHQHDKFNGFSIKNF
jgi:hypothetical protein